MKLAICIPAYNEEQNIGSVIRKIPKELSGIHDQKIFVIDDGSSDQTVKISQQAGAEVIEIKPHKGLAIAFMLGIRYALDWGADFIVNIDADGQYRPAEIPLLIEPLLKNEADMVIGNRQVETLTFMPWPKRYGNLIGSWFLRKLTGCHVQDASSGFRACTRKAANRFEMKSTHTYTHENLIQAQYLGLKIKEVPITFLQRKDGSTSRLIQNVLKHIFKSLKGILSAWWRWRS